MAPRGVCHQITVPPYPPVTLPSTVSVTGFSNSGPRFNGGTFVLNGHDCTYELTKQP